MSEVSQILGRRDIQRWLARPYRIRYAPIWLTGGSSADGSIIFLDTDLRSRPKWAARTIWHERVEAAVRACLGWGYLKAHHLATQAERERYGPEEPAFRSLVTKNAARRPKILPRQFDQQLARQAAESVGT